METNRLKQKLGEGRLSLISGNYENSDMVDFVGSLGMFDAVWIDMEHGPVSMRSLADLSRAADLWGMTSIVRVRAIDPAIIGLTLSQGVDGVIVPHVNTREEAELVVDAAKFAPVGHRGSAAGRRSYGRSLVEHYKNSNNETFVAVIIEDTVGVDNLPEILKVQHIDMFFVAHYDLAQSLGLETDLENPKLVQTFDRAVELVVKAGKVAAAAVSENELEKYLSMGVRCLKVPGWQTLIANGARSFVDRVTATRLEIEILKEVRS